MRRMKGEIFFGYYNETPNGEQNNKFLINKEKMEKKQRKLQAKETRINVLYPSIFVIFLIFATYFFVVKLVPWIVSLH